MTKDQIIDELWERSGHGTQREDIVAAYEAGAAAEREACAQVCAQLASKSPKDDPDRDAIGACEDAIRARSKP